MIKRSRFSILTLALALAGLSACDSGANPGGLTGPQMSETDYSWNAVAVGTLTPVTEATYTAVLGRQGGVIRAGDHMLMVPSKAVDSETEFTVRVLGGDQIAVDFSARRLSDGATISQFPTALTFRLSYKNAATTDPYRLYNAYVMEGEFAGAKQRLATTISTLTQTLTSTTTHFSEFVIGID
jgi:hypothetical protein